MDLKSMSKALTITGWMREVCGESYDNLVPAQQKTCWIATRLINKKLRKMLGRRRPFKVLWWKPWLKGTMMGYKQPDLIIGYIDDRLELRLVHLSGDGWIVSVKILNGKPAGARIIDTIKAFTKDLNKPVSATCLPEEWRFKRRNISSTKFTEYIPDDYWLHTFFYVLTQELEQTNKMDRITR